MPESAVVLGDFNMQPDSAEYGIIAEAFDKRGDTLLADIWQLMNPGQEVLTWHPHPERPSGEVSAKPKSVSCIDSTAWLGVKPFTGSPPRNA